MTRLVRQLVGYLRRLLPRRCEHVWHYERPPNGSGQRQCLKCERTETWDYDHAEGEGRWRKTRRG